MRILVILGHPDKNSFNHAIAYTVVNKLKNNNHEFFFHDLQKENFNPVMEAREISKNAQIEQLIQEHCFELTQAEGIIIIHPNWWGQPPAILKGWIDRVIRPGVAYEFSEGDMGEGVPIGLLKAKVAIVFNTSDTSEERENNVFKDPLEIIWKNCIFDLCGVKIFYRKMFKIVVTSTELERRNWLNEVEHTIDKYFPKK
jgi:putative NADPH-quinone reductase